MNFKFQYRLFIPLIIGFVLCTVIGTLSHECGHIAVARWFKASTTLHYASMNYQLPDQEIIDQIYFANQEAIDNEMPFEGEEEFQALNNRFREKSTLITLGGPLQTMLFGSLGLIALIWRRKKLGSTSLNWKDWSLIFLALFWLRQVFNLTHALIDELISPNGSPFGIRGDEVSLSRRFGLWEGTLPISTGVLGVLVALLVIFKYVPRDNRFTFIISGLTGSVLGYVLWMVWLGPVVLP